MPDDPAYGPATALLVIHGIGEQNPYETLDQVARGFVRYFRGRNLVPALRPERLRHADGTEVAIHLEFPEPYSPRGERRLTLFEFYWAPFTEGKATTRGILAWLIRTTLTPLRYLADNLLALLDTREHNSRGRVAWLMLREVGRAVLVYIPFLVIVSGVVALFVRGIAPVSEASRAMAATVRSEPNQLALGVAAVCVTMAVVLGVFVARELWHWWRRPTPSTERKGEVAWVVMAVALAALFWLAAAWISRTGHVDAARYSAILMRRSHLWVVVFGVLILVLRRVLVDYVGDIAVYVTADAKQASYEARTAILKASTAALARLLRRHDRVIVLGHSLGSVIAYDTINELLSRVWASPDAGTPPAQPPVDATNLGRLQGLVTFGSPLDKVYYFFREHVASDQAVRAQILSFLYSFRRGYSGRTYGDFKFSYAAPAGPDPSAFPDLGPGFRWINFWAFMDPVSGPLHFYRLEQADRLRCRYWIWGLAHLAYWNDQRLYGTIAERFL